MRQLAILPLLLAAACLGSITGGDVDPPDDPPQDPPTTPVTDVKLVVRDGATPQPGVKVIFQNADDTLIADVTTDATGTATAPMPNGGNVTVIRTYPPTANEPAPADQLSTYTGVKPGERIELAGRLRETTPFAADIEVGLTNGELVGVMTPCGSGYGTAPRIRVVLEGCGAETELHVINFTGEIDPVDNTQSGPLSFVAHATLAPTIDLTGEVFRGTLSTQLTASNTSAQETTVALQKRLVVAGFAVFDTGTLGGPTVTTDVPDLPGTEQLVSAHVIYGGRSIVISQRAAYTSAPSTIDIVGGLIAVSRAPALAGDLITWTQDGAGIPDYAVARVGVTAANRNFVRAVVAPYTGPAMRLPTLPAGYERYAVTTTDTVTLVHHLGAVTGGYDAARPRVFNHDLADIAPLGGHASVSSYATSYTRPAP